MKAQDIKIMMDKFYNAELSAEEEKLLKDKVLNSNSEEYSELKDYFLTMEKLEKEEFLDSDFDNRIIELLEKNEPIKRSIKINWRSAYTIAASVLILVSVWLFNDILNTKEVYGTISDPEIAFAETKQILQKVNKNVKKGVNPASKSINKVDDGIKKTENVKKAGEALEDIKKLNKLNEPGQLLKSISTVTVKAG